MKQNHCQIGKQSIRFENPPQIIADACIVGEKEGEGPYRAYFDRIEKDPYFGQNSWEEAESELQLQTASLALHKANMEASQLRCIFAGDLLGQNIATSFGLIDLNRPLFGLYGACSTIGESLALGAMAVAGGFADKVLCLTSSHFGSAEKQFRFPLEYGNQRPLSATWTVMGSGAFILSSWDHAAQVKNAPSNEHTPTQAKQTPPAEPTPGHSDQTFRNQVPEDSAGAACPHLCITGITPGVITDYGVSDSMNMGAAMAPAACNTIYQHFQDFSTNPSDYDKIITGDLGTIGQEILCKLLSEKGYDIAARHMDCGIEIFDSEAQDTHAGGSGCGCSAVMLSAYILRKLRIGEWKRVLMVPTGALLSTVSFNEGQTVPGIAHAVVIERM